MPYPILLVVGGLALAFVPGLPQVHIDPELVLLLFLPPLLFAAAWFTSWRDFAANKRPIALLAIGLVVVTTTAVAWVAHALIPGMTWPVAFVLGAIVSPPDAVAATAVTSASEDPAPDRHHPRGREPGQRRDRPGRLSLRARGRHDRQLLAARTPPAASRSSRRAGSRSASSSAG